MFGALVITDTQLQMIITGIVAIIIGYFQYRIKAQVDKVEVATNSMKDALVSKTESEALLRGAQVERDLTTAQKKTNGPSAVRYTLQELSDFLQARNTPRADVSIAVSEVKKTVDVIDENVVAVKSEVLKGVEDSVSIGVEKGINSAKDHR